MTEYYELKSEDISECDKSVADIVKEAIDMKIDLGYTDDKFWSATNSLSAILNGPLNNPCYDSEIISLIRCINHLEFQNLFLYRELEKLKKEKENGSMA